MMDTIIQRIVDMCPAFDGRVTGIADPKKAGEIRRDATLPMGFVCFGAEDLDEEFSSGVGAMVTITRYAVVVVVDNSDDKDGRGHKSSVTADGIRASLLKALHDWKAPGALKAVKYAGGEYRGHNQARAWFQFDFDVWRVVVADQDPEDTANNDLLISEAPDIGAAHESDYESVVSD